MTRSLEPMLGTFQTVFNPCWALLPNMHYKVHNKLFAACCAVSCVGAQLPKLGSNLLVRCTSWVQKEVGKTST